MKGIEMKENWSFCGCLCLRHNYNNLDIVSVISVLSFVYRQMKITNKTQKKKTKQR